MSFQQEAVRQWAWAYGSERPDQCWILSDYDTWERNPFYTGPDQRHPEDYGLEDEETCDLTGCDDMSNYVCDNDYFDDDIPF